MSHSGPLIEARGLEKSFTTQAKLFMGQRRLVKVLTDMDLSVNAGEIVGIIGASGSGKSTLARLLTRLDRPDAGEIRFDGNRIDHLSDRELIPLRRRLQLIPQDSSSSLNPRKKIGSQLVVPMLRLGLAESREQALAAARSLLERVGLRADDLERYPHEFSGGQRQRINIARSLGVRATCLILDEPTSALDVSVQSRILALLVELKQQFGLTYLFISHNLAVVQSFCDRIVVIDRGRCVENLSAIDVHKHARHPATRRLLDAVLSLA